MRKPEFEFRSFSLTDIGRLRSHNEDSAGIIKGPGYTLLCVFDGMGGHRKGELASSMALNAFRDAFEPLTKTPSLTAAKRLIKETLTRANAQIFDTSKAVQECAGMGTTAVVAIVFAEQTLIANMGDSRCYTLKPRRVTLDQITVDDSYVEMLVKKGRITRQQARVHPDRNIITNALGIQEKMRVKFTQIPSDFSYLMLCSDGLYTMISDQVIANVLRKDCDINSKVVTLVNAANDAGGKDNISVALIERRKI